MIALSFVQELVPRLFLYGTLLASSIGAAKAARWETARSDNKDLPGQNITVTREGKVVARLIYGEGQQIPYLALYDEEERRVTNAGLDRIGKEVGHEPHHRGIFLGWQKVRSDLGVANLWSMREGTRMQVVNVEQLATNKNSALIVARIEWRAGTKDATGSDLLLTETRRLVIGDSSIARGTQVDLSTKLVAERELTLDGDVQHAGIHLRVAHPVALAPTKTSYLWSPNIPAGPGKVVSDRLQWGEFVFPLEDRWYRAAQLNAPPNPVEEFSTREYGRFGYFFKRALGKNEALALSYRFLLARIAPPAELPKRSAAELVAARKEMDAAYAEFVPALVAKRMMSVVAKFLHFRRAYGCALHGLAQACFVAADYRSR